MKKINNLVKDLLVVIEKLLHLAILCIVVYLCGREVFQMFIEGRVGVSSVMLIFIYLEIIQMIQIYFDSEKNSGEIPSIYMYV